MKPTLSRYRGNRGQRAIREYSSSRLGFRERKNEYSDSDFYEPADREHDVVMRCATMALHHLTVWPVVQRILFVQLGFVIRPLRIPSPAVRSPFGASCFRYATWAVTVGITTIFPSLSST
jgi:hypothetical protein